MKAGFCWNSRRWIIFMIGSNTKTCPLPPIGTQCDNCGYYEEREVTESYIQKDRMIRRIFSDKENK